MTAAPRTSLLAACLALATSRLADAQVLRARATDALSGAPIPNVIVTVLGDVAQRRADSTGHIVLPLKHGGASLVIVQRLGYGPISTTLDVPTHDTLNVHFVMQPTATSLDTVSVVGARPGSPFLEEFERRLRAHTASFVVTRGDIDHQIPILTTDLLRRDPGLSVLQKGLRTVVVSNRMAPPCIATVGLDGQIMDNAFDLNAITAEMIHGIEVFDGAARIPPQYGGTRAGMCALVMVWLRH